MMVSPGMGGSSNNNSNSFIPKRGSGTRPRRAASRQMYLFTLISYIVFFATLLASIGVFLYGRYVNSQFVKEVAALNQEMERFHEADMEKVQAFDARLTQAYSRLDNNVSLPTVFTALETATAQSVQLTRLSLTREDDNRFLLDTEIETDTFDSAIFQRELLESSDLIAATLIDNIAISTGQAAAGSEGSDAEVAPPGVTFSAELVVPVEAVPFVPEAATTIPEPPVIESEATTTEGSSDLTDTDMTVEADDMEVNDDSL